MASYTGSIDISKAIDDDVKDGIPPQAHPLHSHPLHEEKLTPQMIGVLLLGILLIGAYVLTQSQRLGIIEDKVTEQYWEGVKTEVIKQVQTDYGKLSILEQNKRAQQLYLEARSDPKRIARLEQEIEITKDFMKDETGTVYPYGVDSYYYLRQTRNLLEYGTVGEQGATDLLAYAPVHEFVQSTRGYVYTQYYWYLLTRPFFSTFEGAMIYLPVALGLGSLLLTFLIGNLLFGPYAGLLSAFLLSLSQRFFVQNYAGFLDTSPLNLFLSLLFFLSFLKCSVAPSRSSISSRVFFGFLMLLAAGLLYFSWTGSFYIWIILAGYGFTYGILHTLKERRYGTLSGVILSGVFLTLIFLQTNAYDRLSTRLFPPLTVGTFNPGFFMVSELKESTLFSVIEAYGGYVIVLAALLSLGYLLYQVFSPKSIKRPELFLLVWLIPLLFAGVLSRRFMYYSAPPFALLLAYGCARIIPPLGETLKSFSFRFKHQHLLAMGIIALLLFGFLTDDLLRTREFRPAVDDAIVKTSRWLETQTPSDSVIVTWWDYGYIYPYYARRSVLFGPNSFSSSRNYWMSRFFLATNTSVSRGHARAMNCFADNVLYGFVSETDRMKKNSLYERLISLPDTLLREELTSRNAPPHVLKAALCTPPPSYVVVNEDYLGKIASMATLAEQDFMNPILREKEVQVSRISTCLARNGVVSCDNSYRIEGTSATNNGKHPRALYSYLNGTMEKTAYSDGVSGFSFVLYRVGEDIHSFLIEDTYAQSILVRMIARDSRIPGFELVHTEDYPRQMGVYAVTFD